MPCSIQYQNSNININISEDKTLQKVTISFDDGRPDCYKNSIVVNNIIPPYFFENIKKPKGQIVITADLDDSTNVIYEVEIDELDIGHWQNLSRGLDWKEHSVAG